MGAHFDALLAAGITEAFDPAAGTSEHDFAAVVNPLHVVPKPDGDIRPIIDPTRTARRYMAFRHPVTNQLQRYVALPFGASQSPPIFVELTTAATTIFQTECDRRGLSVTLFTYVDDFMIMGKTHADVVGAFAVMDELGAELGLEWKASKDRGRDVPLQQLDWA
ncbi:hypothetical protein GPECTOR_48g406 [Gonium pectorale]|uniref:Reverse transcriptase domain-containing protein n=1 Tax=Gonium pectorale TaxID=33097 RepID=A0A150G820_GONPE|nr:hypothetical protein GPECTOR_48g406 [Gonium pectorale]|eukprot:KXZ45974.1 hypothetical protein GPECTOR_48g406 [Gonium pectorale]